MPHINCNSKPIIKKTMWKYIPRSTPCCLQTIRFQIPYLCYEYFNNANTLSCCEQLCYIDIKQAKLWTVWLNYDVESATAEEANVYTIDLKTNRFRREDNRNVQSKDKQRPTGNDHWSDTFIREFGIKHNRYVFCRVARAGKIAIRLPVQSCSGGMASYPQLAN